MRNRNRESGQIMPMVALLMVVIIGMAAFAIDGSNIYSQHRKLQADLDVAVKVAASEMFDFDPSSAAYTSTAQTAISDAAKVLANDGYANTLTSPTSRGITAISADYHNGFCGIDSAAGITICTPPQSGPFAGTPHYDYVEGRLSQNIGGFFGGVLGFGVMHISVRAVGWHGGLHEPYAIIGLDSNPANHDCSIQVQNASASLAVTGSIMANAWSCNAGTANVSGHSDQVSTTDTGMITGTSGTNTGVPMDVDPFAPISVTATEPVTVVNPGQSIPPECQAELAYYTGNSITNNPTGSKTIYYFPPADGSFGAYPSSGTVAQDALYFMPRCDGSQTGSPGLYYFPADNSGKDDSHLSGQSSVNSFNSVLVFDSSSSVNTLLKDTGNDSWKLNGPTSGPYAGIAISEERTQAEPPCPNGTPTFDLSGNANGTSSNTYSVDGVIDLPCSMVTIGGHSNLTVNGVLVAYNVVASGNGTATGNYDPTNIPADKGSVLVE